MKRELKVVLGIVGMLALMIGAWFIRATRRLDQLPKAVQKSFSAWEGGWKLPPLQPARYDGYELIVRYPKGARPLEDDLKIKVIDLATGKAQPIDGRFVGGWQGNDPIVAALKPKAVRRYEVIVDPEHVRELAEKGASLVLGMASSESGNRIRDALWK